jgi:hypothetical protein
MLAIVKSAASMRSPLLYNTQKVEEKKALFLEAHNFLPGKEELTMQQELETFQRLTQLNERSKQHAVHISLNFAEYDHLNERQLIRIADDFMRGIDFGDQPWLLYQHIDAGHPHLHIVTTNIRPDGSRISNDLRSPNHLKQLCHQLEEKHNLIPAIPMPGSFGISQTQREKKNDTGQQLARYGRMPTKKQIENILRYVNRNFSVTSFDAYNAVIGLYRVRADRGRQDSEMYRSGGLYYRMIDEEGRKIGAPIKASDFNEPVTLKKLEQKFTLDQETRKSWQENGRNELSRLRTIIDITLLGIEEYDYSLRCFADDLLRNNIHLVIPALRERPTRQRMTEAPRQLMRAQENTRTDDGHAIFYVDVDSKTVIRDTALGPAYTGASILQRTGVESELRRLWLEKKLELPKNCRPCLLQPDYPNTAETRNLLLRLSPQHDRIVGRAMEEHQLQQQQSRGLRHSF